MPSIMPPTRDMQDGTRGVPRPTTCPLCGLTADNAVLVRGEVVATATFCCTEGHLFSVTWAEVA